MAQAPSAFISKYRADIDGLRAIAVLLVVGYHAFPSIFPGGFIGVDVFFVISGFLITGIIVSELNKNSFSFLRFFFRRVVRLFPVLLVVLATCLAIGWFLLMPSDFMELGKHIVGGVGYIANFMQWRESGYFAGTAESKPLMHLWSLGIEEQFYLIWPLILVLGFKTKTKLINVVLICLIISFVLNVVFIPNHSEAVFYLPIFRFWELLVGAILALSPTFWNPPSALIVRRRVLINNVCSVVGISLIGFSAWGLTKFSLFPGWWALGPTVGAFLLIGAGPDSWMNQFVLSRRGIVWIGLISYPLYLWHWPLISFFHLSDVKMPCYFERHIAVLVSLILAWLSYRFVEQPLRHRRNLFPIAVILLGISILIGLAGYTVFIKNGVRGRLPDQPLNAPGLLIELMNPELGGDVQEEWRHHKCFLGKGEAEQLFAAECIEEKRPLVFLWGDSHAASLYVGLKDLQRSYDFGIIQRTASFCPPAFGWDNPQNRLCKEINDRSLKLVYKLNPDVILLEGQWVTGGYDLQASLTLVEQLRVKYSGKIVLLGSAPLWAQSVPKNIVSYYKRYNTYPPQYTDFGTMLVNETFEVDKRLRSEAKRMRVNFISIFETMCHGRECLLQTGSTATDVTSFDQGHLSPAGSRFLMNEIADEIFAGTIVQKKVTR